MGNDDKPKIPKGLQRRAEILARALLALKPEENQPKSGGLIPHDIQDSQGLQNPKSDKQTER